MQATFQIFVKTLTGSTITLDTNLDNTVLQTKRQLATSVRLPVGLQRLIFQGKQLEDNRTLASYGIDKEATLRIALRTSHKMTQQSATESEPDMVVQLTVRSSASGRSVCIDQDLNATVSVFKERISELHNVPAERQLLQWGEHALQNDEQLST